MGEAPPKAAYLLQKKVDFEVRWVKLFEEMPKKSRKTRARKEESANPKRPWPLHYWRLSPWLEAPNSLAEKQRERHEAALKVLDDYNEGAVPFALLLRTFRIGQTYCHSSDGGDGGQNGILLDVHFSHSFQAKGLNVLSIQDKFSRHPLIASDAPALMLKTEFWEIAAIALIHCAELIISECQFLTPGVITELNACIDIGKVDQTVLILPTAPFKFLGHEKETAKFPRVIHQHDLDLAAPAKTAIFTDLIDRMEQIAALEASERLKLTQNMLLLKVFPVTYQGVAEWLLGIAEGYAKEQNEGALVFVGQRASLAAKAGSGFIPYMAYRLETARLCAIGSSYLLACVLINEIETDLLKNEGDGSRGECEGLLDFGYKLREEVIGVMFEAMMTPERANDLWRSANSLAANALERRDNRSLSQCFAWMTIAALLVKNYERAIDHGIDAVTFGKFCGDHYRQAFAQYYLGCAYYWSGRLEESVVPLSLAIQLFPEDKKASIVYCGAALTYAKAMEKLGESTDAKEYYQIALDIGTSLKHDGIVSEASELLARLEKK